MTNLKHVIIAAVLLLQLAAVVTIVPASSRANDYNNGDTVNTPWAISNVQTYTGGFLNIRNNVTVANGGVLTLDTYDFRWQPTATNTFGIKVEKGGTLVMKNSDTRSTNVNDYWFKVMRGGNISVTGGKVDDVGKNVNDPVFGEWYGIIVFADNAVFETVTFDRNLVSIQFAGASGGRVLNSTFMNVLNYGMNVFNSTDILVKGSTFSTSQAIFSDTSQLMVDTCKFLNENSPIFSTAGSLDIIGSTFTNPANGNTPVSKDWGWLNVTGSTFDAIATTPASMIWTANAKARISDNTFTNGEGVYIYGYNTNMNVINNTFSTLTYSSPNGQHIFLLRSSGLISKNNFNGKPSNIAVYCTESKDMAINENKMTNVPVGVVGDMSTNLTIRKNTFDGSSQAIQVEKVTDALVEANTVTNTNEFIRIWETTDTTVKDNIMTLTGNNFVNAQSATATLEGNDVKMTAVSPNTIYMGTGANLVVKRDKYDMNGGLFAQMVTMGPGHGSFYVEDTTIRNANTFTEIGSHPFQVWFVNSTFDPSPSKNPWSSWSYGNPGSNLYYGWWTTVEAKWQNDAIAPNSTITVTDALGHDVVKGSTGQYGRAGPFPVYAGHLFYSEGNVVNESLNDNTFKANFKGANGTKTQAITGNTNVVVKMTDDTPGAINFTTPNGWATNGDPVTVEGFATDNGSGIEKVVVKAGGLDFNGTLNGTQWSATMDLVEGDYLLEATAYDVVGNKVNATINITVDRTAPTVIVNTPHFLNTETFNLEGMVDDDTILFVIDGHIVPVTNGSFSYHATVANGTDHDFVINATDAAANTAEYGWNVEVSIAKPTLVVDVVDGLVTNQTSLKVTGTVSASVISVIVNGVSVDPEAPSGPTARFNATTTLLEGSNVLNVMAVDLYGNEVKVNRTVVLDTKAPELNVTSPEGLAASVNTANVTVEGTVTEVNTITIRAMTYDVSNGSFSAEVTGLDEGENIVVVEATDPAGNTAKVTLSIFVDTVPPRVAITSPASPLYTNMDTVTIVGTVDDGAALRVNGAQANYTNGTFSVPVQISAATTQIEVTAADAVGNVGRAVLLVTFDGETSVTISEDVKSKTSEATAVISGVAEPGAAVTVNGVAAQVASDGSFNLTVALEEGKNTFTVKVTDRAGNTAQKDVEIERTPEAGMGAVGADLAILLMVLGIFVGGACGYIIGKKARGPAAGQRPPQRPAPVPPPPEARKPPTAPVAQARAAKAKEEVGEEEEEEEEDEEAGDEDEKEKEDEEEEEEEEEKEDEEEDEEADEEEEEKDDDLDDLLKKLDKKK